MTGDVHGRFDLPAHTSISNSPPPDLIIVTVKAYDTQNAVRQLRGHVRDDTMILTLQNGLGNLELLREWRGIDAFAGTTTMGATLLSPGKVRISGLGKTMIGSEENPEGALHIVRAFAESGVPVEHSHDIVSEIWAKIIVSSCINPLTAVLRVPNGKLLQSEIVRRLMKEVCIEGEQVANVMGIRLPSKDMYARTRAVALHTAPNLSSMLQDVMKGRRTEISQINGALYEIASRHDLTAPLNAILTAMVSAMSDGQRGWQKG